MREKVKKLRKSIQPRLPKIRKGEEPGQERPQEPSDQNVKERKRLLLGIGLIVVVLVVALIILWSYPPAPAGPGNRVSDSQVRAEAQRLEGINEYPENLRINPADYPKVLGVYWKNNLTLEEKYFCSDVCPDYGRVYLVYQGVDSGECAGIGKEIRDLAWGGYIGCGPKVE